MDSINQICILTTVAASGIPRAAPQKHKDFQWFLKGALVGSSGDATTHFAPARGLAQGHTAKSFIFTRFLKGFGLLVRFGRY